MTTAIQVEGLSKQYTLGQLHRDTTLRETVMNLLKRPFRKGSPKKTLWALKDVGFSVEEGEVVGLIGRNGAGKSTLLKVLSRITYPTSGSIRVSGKVASLLEVGTGFHQELTGRENIYLNGSILGMGKKEIDSKIDQIVEFSGVERFLDTPIKRFSSGMKLRLGFAVAAHLDPEILLVDEVLAVGDAGFQKKCLKAMDDMRTGGRTVLFVSHNLEAVENLCSRAIWIDQGQVRADGPSKKIIKEYLSTFAGGEDTASNLGDIEQRRGSGEIKFTGVEFLDRDGNPQELVRAGDGMVIRVHCETTHEVCEPHFGIEFYTEFGTLVFEVSTWALGMGIPVLAPGPGHLDFEVDFLNLMPGTYSLSLWCQGVGGIDYDIIDHCARLTVESSDYFNSGRGIDSKYGLVFFPCRWKTDGLAILNR